MSGTDGTLSAPKDSAYHDAEDKGNLLEDEDVEPLFNTGLSTRDPGFTIGEMVGPSFSPVAMAA